MVTIGIPRSLLYYPYGELMSSFYRCLGAEVVTSGETTRETIDRGVKLCVDEACLPVKCYFGHVESLIEKSDYILVPRFVSVRPHSVVCPKLMGIPDMLKAVFGERIHPIDPLIDTRSGPVWFRKALIHASRTVTRNPLRIEMAWRTAREGLMEPLSREDGVGKGDLEVGVIGHSYVTKDSYISMGLLDRLVKMGVRTRTVDDRVFGYDRRERRSKIFWSYEQDMFQAVGSMLGKGGVHGVVLVRSFGCGPGSMVFDLIERECRRDTLCPVLDISLDEHTGDAGVATRVEAFVDMLRRRESLREG